MPTKFQASLICGTDHSNTINHTYCALPRNEIHESQNTEGLLTIHVAVLDFTVDFYARISMILCRHRYQRSRTSDQQPQLRDRAARSRAKQTGCAAASGPGAVRGG